MQQPIESWGFDAVFEDVLKFNKDISRKVEGKLAGRVCTVKQVLAKNRRPVR